MGSIPITPSEKGQDVEGEERYEGEGNAEQRGSCIRMGIALEVFDQPQGHWNVVYDLRNEVGGGGDNEVDVDANGKGRYRSAGIEWESSIV
jgi:hypothetical protein